MASVVKPSSVRLFRAFTGSVGRNSEKRPGSYKRVGFVDFYMQYFFFFLSAFEAFFFFFFLPLACEC